MVSNETGSDPPGIEKVVKKFPTFLSPKWFWVILTCIFSVSFWTKGLKNPEAQAYYHVSSAITAGQIFGLAAAINYIEVNVPWLYKFGVMLVASVKAVCAVVATIAVATWNIITSWF